MKAAIGSNSARIALKLLAGCMFVASCSGTHAQPSGEIVDLKISTSIEVGPADPKTKSVVGSAQAFLATLTDAQRRAVVYNFQDNRQRARWSNLPAGVVQRGGIMRKDLDTRQNAALETLLAQVLSAKGVRNARLQMAADDTLVRGTGGPNFGSGFYYVSFLGEPSPEAPWTLQFGGHHLALNVTFVGARASFSPMLTGGQPLTVQDNEKPVYITREEVTAGQALLASLNPEQRKQAIRGAQPINILAGPGEFGAVIAPEGIRGSELTQAQKRLLLAVVEARVGHFNDRDAKVKMTSVQRAIDDTYFGWWGPASPAGAAYFRVTGPQIVLEYGPQSLRGGAYTEHAHNMYRDPTNDYGSAWIAARK